MKKETNLIIVDLSNTKNWNECQKIMNLITSGSLKITTKKLNYEKITRKIYQMVIQ